MIQLNWKPDKDSQTPLYIQIVSYFKEHILSGQWPMGSVLPTQRDLAHYFQVNRSTIVSAMDELKSEGFIEGRGKGGTRVTDNFIYDMAPLQPNWHAYINEGIHMPNFDTIKKINDLEYVSDLIRLSSGEGSKDLFPADKMATVLKAVADEMEDLGYVEPYGLYGLRVEIAKYLKQYDIDANPASILIVSGALQAIQLISMGLLQTGATVLLEKPSYLYSLKIFQSMGMRRKGIPIDKEGIQTETITKSLPKHGSSMLYTIPNYQNPTGTVMSLDRRKSLIQVCEAAKLPVIEDDVYRELWIDEPPPAPIKSLDQHGNVLYVGSVSKTLSPGLRIGWIVGPEPVIERLADIKMQMDYGSSSLSQLTVQKWFETGLYASHLTSLRENLKKRRQATLEALNRHFNDIATWKVPSGGYYVWVQLNHPAKMQKIFDEACDAGILVYPGYLYDNEINYCIRISYSYAKIEEIETGLKSLSDIVKRNRL